MVLACLLLVFSAKAQTDVLHLKSDVVDTIFGRAIADPYRWMEHLESDSVKQWLIEQKKLTKAEQKLFSGRMANAAANISSNWAFTFTSEEKTGPWYFQMMMSANPYNPAPVLYYRENTDDHWLEAFNPNEISQHLPHSISHWALSDSGGFLAVGISTAGSDWQEIRVRNLYKQKDLKDRINWVRFSTIVWWHNGFFYARYDSSGQNSALGGQQLYYHKLGDNQAKDELIISTPADEGYSNIEFHKTSNNRYLVVDKNQKIGNNWYQIVAYKDLKEGLDDEWKYIVQVPAKDKAFFKVVDYADSGFIVYTNYKKPFGRVFRADPNIANHFVELVPACDKVIKKVTYVHHELIVTYFTKGRYEVCMFNAEGDIIHNIKVDAGIEIEGFEGAPDDSETIFYERLFYLPTMAERYDFKEQKHEPVNKTKIAFDGGAYMTEVVTFPSKDGTEISMYLTHKRGLKLKGNNPVILFGYGGFGMPITPFYNYSNIIFFDNNGILAVPMIRGGGELGAEWHDAGKKLNKQNSFDDFVAAGEYLIKQGYTSKERLAIEGGSNGGLLVGAVITQHPELCQVAVAHVGVYDMLRFNKFTGGKYWLSEYGSPDNEADFNNLLGYSPVHNVRAGINYPATLLLTGKNDDRVVPFHTYKFLASLQELSGGNNPHVMYFEPEAGHNGATTYSDKIDEEAFILAFIFTEMHLPLK